jgi:hypothetical protein
MKRLIVDFICFLQKKNLWTVWEDTIHRNLVRHAESDDDEDGEDDHVEDDARDDERTQSLEAGFESGAKEAEDERDDSSKRQEDGEHSVLLLLLGLLGGCILGRVNHTK